MGVILSSVNNNGGTNIGANSIKDFYSIADFFNFIKKPTNTPSTHRHFQMFFYPDISFYKGIQTATTGNNQSFTFLQHVLNNLNNLFTLDIFLKITLSIQKVQLPQKFGINGGNNSIKTPLGTWNGIPDGGYYDATDHSLTITLLDQIRPLFETFFNLWIYACVQGLGDSKIGFGFQIPRVNIAIKYFRLDQMSNSYAEPNFIYYFRGVYPTNFTSCIINHSGDSELEIVRNVQFNFNTCWPLASKLFAARYKLDHLFNPHLVNLRQQRLLLQAAMLLMMLEDYIPYQ